MTKGSPQDLVFTLYGEFLLRRAEPVWVGSLLGLLGELDVAPGAVRTALSRLRSRGWLRGVRSGRRGYYALTARGRRVLEEGEARIYRPPRGAEWDGEWTLVSYSLSEDRRAVRDRLRVRLSWLGCGSLGKGLWIAPHDVADRVHALARELRAASAVQVFRARHLGAATPEQLVAECWDLPALNVRYEAFIRRHLDEFRLLRAGGADGIEPRAAFVRRFELVHEYREFPLLDPFLPRLLQPRDWAGECSQALFQAYHDLLEAPSERYLEAQVERLPRERTAARS